MDFISWYGVSFMTFALLFTLIKSGVEAGEKDTFRPIAAALIAVVLEIPILGRLVGWW